MKRRNFIKGLFGVAAIPVVAKAGLKPERINVIGNTLGKSKIPFSIKDDPYFRKRYSLDAQYKSLEFKTSEEINDYLDEHDRKWKEYEVETKDAKCYIGNIRELIAYNIGNDRFICRHDISDGKTHYSYEQVVLSGRIKEKAYMREIRRNAIKELRKKPMGKLVRLPIPEGYYPPQVSVM